VTAFEGLVTGGTALAADCGSAQLLESSLCEQGDSSSHSEETVMPPAKKSPSKKSATSAKKAAAPAKKAAPAKAAPQATITLKQIAAELAESHDQPKKHAEALLSDLVAATTQHLKNGDKIRLTGLGILQVRSRPARMGRNPATGEAIKIKASRKVAFRPAKELKDSV
jgi:DNA-binding protein HU-beta